MGHTKEPWDGDGAAIFTDDVDIAMCVEHDVGRSASCSNAARIIACVNACKGIANPDALPELLRHAESVLDCIEQSGDDFGTDTPHSVIGLAIALRKSFAKAKGIV